MEKKTAYTKDKNYRINFRTSKQMYDWCLAEANRLNMSVADYCRTVFESYMCMAKITGK